MQCTVADLCGARRRARRARSRSSSAGINHQAFLLRFEHDGESLYPRLDERIAGDPELQRRVRVALYRRFGYFQTESSEHAAEYVPWFMRHDDEIERYRIPVDEYISRSEDEPDRVRAGEGRARRAARRSPLERSNEYAATIVNSMVTGEPSVIYGNVPNTGLIAGLPEGTCVEVPCVVDSNGLRPDAGARLPAAAGGAEPHLRERRRADRARGARGAARTTSGTPRCSTRTRRRR